MPTPEGAHAITSCPQMAGSPSTCYGQKPQCPDATTRKYNGTSVLKLKFVPKDCLRNDLFETESLLPERCMTDHIVISMKGVVRSRIKTQSFLKQLRYFFP